VTAAVPALPVDEAWQIIFLGLRSLAVADLAAMPGVVRPSACTGTSGQRRCLPRGGPGGLRARPAASTTAQCGAARAWLRQPGPRPSLRRICATRVPLLRDQRPPALAFDVV